ncbi:NUDIX domain-containing protein [Hirsutella rhossiliensis]|uniref:NUDIX domain-containing protein n=1 Tax=Hirsutella rhossiliensis TaxID=111463 RepID=A0A9P8MXM6_9HYPO|nr:NUDIX domain-containing protein [Hirsutella rhossiliensis]KAH0962279.1 NUDIX domain-containing protein [Hirsutella rhossiliensis]
MGDTKPRSRGAMVEARPSASVMVLSAANEVLVLQRVQSSTSFASAHVFPGGNLDAFHDGAVPGPQSPARHRDGPAYRMAAVRECFEETGILLATGRQGLISLPAAERDAARARIHANEVPFGEWLASVGGVADTENLIPFTRWITPVGVPKRFTTQMYVYQLPLSRSAVPSEMLIPTPDNGVEHTAALFAPAHVSLGRVADGSMTLFPPQYYLLHLLNGFLGDGNTSSSSSNSSREPIEAGPLHRAAQRKKLLAWLRRTPTAADSHATARIPWGEKVMCPVRLPVRRADGRVVLGLDKPGPELEGEPRGGDWERVVLVNFAQGGPRDLEIRSRRAVLREDKQDEAARL